MFPRFKRCFALLTLVFLTGGQWAALQSVAWLNMTWTNSRIMPLGQAISQTFKPAAKCELCQMVQASRQAEKKDQRLHSNSGLDALLAKQSPSCLGPVLIPLKIVIPPAPLSWSDQPPYRPPRAPFHIA